MTIHCSRCGKVLYNMTGYRVVYQKFNFDMEEPKKTDIPTVAVWRCTDCVPQIVNNKTEERVM